jgi:hypothetical protein
MSFRERPFCHKAAHHRRLVIAGKQDRLRDRTYIRNSYFKEMLMAHHAVSVIEPEGRRTTAAGARRGNGRPGYE